MRRREPQVAPESLRRIAREYRQAWGVPLHRVRADGSLPRAARTPCPHAGALCAASRARAIEEALRWGEPTVTTCPRGRLLWAVPLMCNARVDGALLAAVPERRVLPDADGRARVDVRAACAHLRELAERENLTNAALLAARRAEYGAERQRAEAIHQFKAGQRCRLPEMYLREEPAIVAAVRRDDRRAAREILNRLLVVILHQAGDRLDLAKSFFMELVVTMCRTAIQVGGRAEELLAMNYAAIAELARIEAEEPLARWLHVTLERILDAIRAPGARAGDVLIPSAMDFMREHLEEDLPRDVVARAVDLSPSHFSRLFRRHAGCSFTDALNRMRIDRAAELLVRTDLTLTQIALRSGFRDHSYFTKVFRARMRTTPSEYRRLYRAGR